MHFRTFNLKEFVMDKIPERAPLVARTTEKLIAWAHILLNAAKYGKSDLVLAYDDVIREMGEERQLLHEERVIERNSHPPPPPTPAGLPATPVLPANRTTTLPCPPPLPKWRKRRRAKPRCRNR